MSNCSQHKKDIAGISDMELLAEMIGNLHYETLANFTYFLKQKLERDGYNDKHSGRINLGVNLIKASLSMQTVYHHINDAWQICKPLMAESNTIMEYYEMNGKIYKGSYCKTDFVYLMGIGWKHIPDNNITASTREQYEKQQQEILRCCCVKIKNYLL